MKNINFLNSISAKQHNELTRWYRISCALLMVLIASGILIELKQLHSMRNLKTEFSQLKSNALQFDTLINTKQKLKKEELELAGKMQVINEYISKSPATYGQLLLIGRAKIIQLESLSVENQNICINGYCNGAQDATGIMQQCNSTHCFNQLKLTAMYPKTTQQKTMIHISLKGTLKNELPKKSPIS